MSHILTDKLIKSFDEVLKFTDNRNDKFENIKLNQELKEVDDLFIIFSDIVYLRKIRLKNSNIYSNYFNFIKPEIIDLKIQFLFQKVFNLIENLHDSSLNQYLYLFLFYLKPESKNLCLKVNDIDLNFEKENIFGKELKKLIFYAKDLLNYCYFDSFKESSFSVNGNIYKLRIFKNKIYKKKKYNIFLCDSIGDNIFFSKIKKNIDICISVPGLIPALCSKEFLIKIKILIESIFQQNYLIYKENKYELFINVGCGVKILLAQCDDIKNLEEILISTYEKIKNIKLDDINIHLNKYLIPLPTFKGIGVQGDDLRLMNYHNLNVFDNVIDSFEQSRLEPFIAFKDKSLLEDNLRIHSREIHPKIIQNKF